MPHTGNYVLHRFVLFHLVSVSIEALWLGDCNKPLGISTGYIPDSALTASSSHDMIVGPHRARLGRDFGGGAWCPRGMVDKNQLEYIEVDLGSEPRLVTGVGTQGRFANNFGVEYTPAFTVEFTRPGAALFHPFAIPPGSNETLLFVGNTDTFTEIKNEFDLPLLTSRVRIRPISVHPRVVCLRFELYGCNYSESLHHYEIEERSERYYVGEGILYDGSVTTSLSLEAEVPTDTDQRIPKVKRSINDKQSVPGYSRDRLFLNEADEAANETGGIETSSLSETLIQPSDEIDASLSIPVIPPGEIVAPELPLNVTFIFNKILNFSKIFIYIDPIHPLIAGAHPILSVSANFGLDPLTWLEPQTSVSFPLENEAQNVTILAHGRPAQILEIIITVDRAEINIQEIYFESDDCNCNYKPKPSQVPVSVPHLPLESHISKVLPKKKNVPSSDAPPSVRTIEEKDKRYTKAAVETLRLSSATSSGSETAIKISSGKPRNFDSKSSSYKPNPVTTVWAINTEATHRTYAGVAIGFSVGVGLLLSVWIYLWVKSSRSKVSSPRMFRRSPPPDTLDMACLMDGNISDLGMVTPTNDDYSEIGVTCARPSKIIKQSISSQDTFGYLKCGQINNHAEDTPHVPLVSCHNDSNSRGSFCNNRSIYFGHATSKETDYDEIYTKPNNTKNKFSIFGLPKKNLRGTKPDAPLEPRFNEIRPHQNHLPDISFISSEGEKGPLCSWNKNANFTDFTTFNDERFGGDTDNRKLQF